ncbi:trypsin-like serine protease [Corallococcus macrosporus]|uniref:Trypsin-like serine protease n=1 Tax=Corallococcus macrosporus TaxID=35 RepID=A0ABS3DPL4_9BACT|nr:trypsin-like serine protease [Corallococcus macrosporus]MBN8233259.1 trypsin-like serine protease [Corallococcus macrosporus]
MISGQNVRRWAAASVVSLLVVGCGPQAAEEKQAQPETPAPAATSQEIVGGTATTIGANPWQVSLQSSGGSHFCGGSIINENWILTAQHCVNSGGSISKPGRIVAGVTNRTTTTGGQVRTVAQVFVYPGYVDANVGKDAALLKLSSPLDLSGANVKAIPLVTAADAAAGVTNPGVVARVTGWGTLSSGSSSLPSTLQTVDVNLISNADAQADYQGEEVISADQLGAKAPGKDSCQGDSGGPLTVLKGSTRVLAGIVSWGYGCADAQYAGMYGRVSSFESWITNTINGSSQPAVTLLEKSALSGASGSFTHYAITVPSGASSLTVVQSGGTGDADLYVRQGSQPTTTTYTCRPYLSGNAETCTISAPAAGTWYVSVRGYSAYSGVAVKATVP